MPMYNTKRGANMTCITLLVLSSCSDMEVVPNSSGEGSTCDEMSQEFPPLTGS